MKVIIIIFGSWVDFLALHKETLQIELSENVFINSENKKQANFGGMKWILNQRF